jgi:hypothetical protein
MEPLKKSDKRRYVRSDLIVPIKYRVFKNDSTFKRSFSIGRAKDLSMKGLKWEVSRHNPVGTKLDMEIELSNTLGVYVVGKVVGGEDETIEGILHQYDRVTFVDLSKPVQDLLWGVIYESLKKNAPKKK